MSDPVFESNNPYCYFTCDRDPTSSEPVVSGIGIPSNWEVHWWNIVTGDRFSWVDRTEDELIWNRIIDSNNLESELPISGWEINTDRSYSEVSSPAFNTEYTPSETNDTFVSVLVSSTSTLLGSALIEGQVDTGSGFVTRAQFGVSGVAATVDGSISFICPAGATYKIIESGNNTLSEINNLFL